MSSPVSNHTLTVRERVGLWLHRQADRRLSRFGVWLMRRTRGSLAARYRVHALVLTTTGRRSGKARSVVLQYFPDGEDCIVVATNDGGASHPAWYHNLAAGGPAQVEIEGRRHAVVATELEGDDAAAWWRRILELSPEYERYARATTRHFPVIRLAPVPDAA